MQTYFKAPWSIALHLISWCSTALLLTVSAIAARALSQQDQGHHVLWALVLPLALLPLCALFIVRGYTVMPDAVLVHRLLWKTRLSLVELQSARVDPEALRGAWRTCGNGGLFSFTGFYWSKRLGSFRCFATSLRCGVVLQFAQRSVVLSPEDPEVFVQAVRARAE